jgi:acetyltransferase-like isoleucine patch superfamily enzyme
MISETAIVETEVIGSGTSIADFAIVRAGARLGRDVTVHPHVVIESGVEIGDGVEIFPGAYLGKEPKGAGAVARRPEFERWVTIGANCVVGTNSIVYYEVSIGPNTLVGDGAAIREQCSIGERCVVGTHVAVGYAVEVGDRVKIMDRAQVVGNSKLEDGVFIGPGVGMANDPYIGTRDYDDGHVQGATIREGAMVGVGANLLPGIEIGEGALVTAGTLVSRDIPAHVMAAGVPARVLKKPSYISEEGGA